MSIFDRFLNPYRDTRPPPSPAHLNLMERTRAIVAAREELQVRTIADMDMGSSTISDMLLRAQGIVDRPWRAASIREALGVPAIFGAVNLISNVTGSLSMKALRNEVELPPAERPRIIIRPDPFTIPREFYRMTAWNLATRGEAWWWVAARDVDGLPMSVLTVNPAEVTVEEDSDDLRYPIVKWRDKKMPREDFRQLVYAREPGSLRGVGPLQLCGAAISVAVEAQAWAANFFAEGGGASTIIRSATMLGEGEDGEHEADTLRAQWVDGTAGTARVIDPGIESVEQQTIDEQGAQLMGARGRSDVEVATMFNMDATLLNAAIQGSSITYQNVGGKLEDFLRTCLRPNYLEVQEQTMSDLLPRAIVSRFNTSALTMADIQTRYTVYGLGIDKGIITPEEARRFEGYESGDVENAPVPFSPPQAIPTSIPVQMRVAGPVRCDGRRMLRGILRPCNKLLAEAGPFIGRCPRCDKPHGVAA